jgi:hypothetical protein
VSWFSPSFLAGAIFPGERAPGPGSAKPIACDATGGSDLDAVTASGTLEREVGGYGQHHGRGSE